MTKDIIQVLMDMTNGGAEIICTYYPQAKAFFGTKKKFKVRDEKDASACWFQNPNNKFWCITDFGDDIHSHDAIEIAMKEENLDWHSALSMLLNKYGLSAGNESSKPIVSIEQRKPDDEVGRFRYVSDSYTSKDLALWGKHVKEEHLNELGWHNVSETYEVKEDKVIHKSANVCYPIYVRQCKYMDGQGEFYKIYEPRNKDKQYRFRYAGNKPQHYINGLYEAQLQCRKEEEMSAEKRQPVIICCGERDAANAKAFGGKPIWFNSESDFPTDRKVMETLRMLGPDIYFIPDIDTTGIAKGREFALRFPHLKVVWLPMSLKEHMDWRGNPMKDLRDWACLPENNIEVFHNMLADAPSAEYFEINYKGKLSINTAHLHHYLWLNDFGTYTENENGNSTVKFGRRIGCKLVEIKDSNEVIKFLIDNLRHGKTRNDKYNLIDKKRRDLTIESFKVMNALPYDIIKSTAKKEIIAFENCVVEVTAEGLNVISSHQFNGMIPATHVVNMEYHLPKELPITFDYSVPEEPLISLNNVDSYFLKLLVNMSRVYWNEEYTQSGLLPKDYYNQYSCNINSSLLNKQQIWEQWQCLLNKLYAIGYLCARYKKRSESFAPYLLDLNTTAETSNGRSGKGLIFQIIGKFIEMQGFEGRTKNLTEYQHAFDRVTSSTDVMLINDYNPQKAKFDGLYNMISDGMIINPKGKQQFELDFEDSPKVAITSNFILPSSDASTEGRVLYVPVSDYYHKTSPDNDYLEDHTPFDDFGFNLGQDYSLDDWNNDFTIILQCIEFYLTLSSRNMRYTAPLNLLKCMRQASSYSSLFDDWANDYFIPERIGVYIERQDVTANYQQYTGDNQMKAHTFKKCLKAWLENNNYKLNDCSEAKDGRIMRHSQKYNNTCEHFYVSRKKENE